MVAVIVNDALNKSIRIRNGSFQDIIDVEMMLSLVGVRHWLIMTPSGWKKIFNFCTRVGKELEWNMEWS